MHREVGKLGESEADDKVERSPDAHEAHAEGKNADSVVDGEASVNETVLEATDCVVDEIGQRDDHQTVNSMRFLLAKSLIAYSKRSGRKRRVRRLSQKARMPWVTETIRLR